MGRRAVAAASEAVDEAAVKIVNKLPTTLAGIVAVLEYAAAYVRRDRCEWPGNLTDVDEDD